MGSQAFAPIDCRQWAEGFSEERFKREIKVFVEERNTRNLRRTE